MKPFLVAYAATAVAFLIIDGIWLGLIARSFYANQLGDLMRDSIVVAPAALFYLFYAGGLVFLAVRPGSDVSLASVAGYGALVGLMAYGTYDMTNWSTLKNWPPLMSLVDVAWGTVLSASCAVLGALAARAWG